MNRTGIEWTDYTWNPITGCLHGCPYCYARRIAMRFTGHFRPMFHSDRLSGPRKVKKPSKIFACSMSDLLGDWVPPCLVQTVINTAGASGRHTFQFLTKNPERYDQFCWPKNAWLGATVVNMAAMPLVPFTGDISFLSVEPILGPIELLWKPDWIIIGAETGPGAKPPDPRWVDSLTNQARMFEIPVFHKPKLGADWPAREFPEVSP